MNEVNHRHGTVLWGANNIFALGLLSGEDPRETWECRLKGKRLKVDDDPYNPLSPGDRVMVDRHGTILERLPRANAFHRWNIKRNNLQTLAANLDQVVIMGSVGTPPFRPRFLDRALICAEYDSVTPIIAINKTDLGVTDEVLERLAVYHGLGIPVLLFSVETGEGMPELLSLLSNRVTGIVGQSGVGKSSLLQSIFPEVVIKIGEVSEKYQRGRHTTTLARMYLHWSGDGTPDLKIIDTPGVRELGMNFITHADLSFYFKDFDPYRSQCAFSSCTHDHEPGCAVTQAFEDDLIHPDRYESYLRILQELTLVKQRKYE